jgi:hypothetical protein
MSHHTSADSLHSSLPLQSGPANLLVRTGGALGIAGSLIGLAIFLTACGGFDAAFSFSPIPLAMGALGLLLLFLGAIRRGVTIEDSHVLASLFINIMAIVGGLLEVAVWKRWPVFFGQVA